MTTSGVRNHVEHCSIAPKAFKDWFRGLVDGLVDTPPSADQWAMLRAKVEALETSEPRFVTAQESAMRAIQDQAAAAAARMRGAVLGGGQNHQVRQEYQLRD